MRWPGLGLHAKLGRARRKGWLAWYALADSLAPARRASLRCRWCASCRSFRGHMWLQSSRKLASLPLGKPVQHPNGRLEMSAGQKCRVAGIETLQAKYPWVDIVDLHIYLMGFHAGEESSTQDRAPVGRGIAYTQPMCGESLRTSKGSFEVPGK